MRTGCRGSVGKFSVTVVTVELFENFVFHPTHVQIFNHA